MGEVPIMLVVVVVVVVYSTWVGKVAICAGICVGSVYM